MCVEAVVNGSRGNGFPTSGSGLVQSCQSPLVPAEGGVPVVLIASCISVIIVFIVVFVVICVVFKKRQSNNRRSNAQCSENTSLRDLDPSRYSTASTKSLVSIPPAMVKAGHVNFVET